LAGPGRDEALVASRVGWLVALATLGLFCVGSTRPFSWDASNSVGHFIATPSLVDPFVNNVEVNNHVLLSALEHAVYTATGSKDELLLRLPPILFGAAVVGIVAWEIARRWGTVPALAGALVIATNPLVLKEFREVRGYSLMVLCSAVGTHLLVTHRRDPQRRHRRLYGLVMFVGAGTHLYALAVLAVHGVVVGSDRSLLRRWAKPMAAGAAGALLFGVPISRSLGQAAPRRFPSPFPLEVGFDLVGGRVVAFLGLLPIALLGLRVLRRSGDVRRAAVTTAGLVVVAWVSAPVALATRFFIWAVPAAAVVMAAAVSHRRELALVAAAACLFPLVTSWGELGEGQVPNRQAATIAGAIERAGFRACALRNTGAITMAAYDRVIAAVRSVADFSGCNAVLSAAGTSDASLLRAARRRFPLVMRLDAEEPGRAFFDGVTALSVGEAALHPSSTGESPKRHDVSRSP
jgi:hypothetical protein